jgi:tetratricopeptide (TPR) repeat protein
MNEQYVSEALAMGNKAIALDAAADHYEARLNWQKASDYADVHLAGEDIYYWIKSGLGAALLDDGDYQASIAVAKLALDWCLKIKQPLPSLTIAKAYLKLGDRQNAAAHVREARCLVGNGVFEQLDPVDREVMRDLAALD